MGHAKETGEMRRRAGGAKSSSALSLLRRVGKKPGVIRGVIAVLYACALLGLAGVRPLWLDEVIQFWGTCGNSWKEVLIRAADNPGASPLGYLVHHWVMSTVGCSEWSARLPALISSAGCLYLLLALSARLKLPGAHLAAAFWMVCPLILRYSLEGRPYMQGMFFALLAALLQIRLRDACTWIGAVALAASLSAAVYSQPYAVFAPAGFALAGIWPKPASKYAKFTYGAYSIAALLFLPWLLALHRHWAGSGIEESRAGFHFGASVFLLILREFAGGGYLAALPIVLPALYQVCRTGTGRHPAAVRWLASAVAASIVFALAADAALNYFFAIRQIVFMLPFALLLAAGGIVHLWPRRPGVALLPILLFVIASATKDYRYFSDRREDWGLLSSALMDASRGGCILLPFGERADWYTVFRPDIREHWCGSGLDRRVVVPTHSYTNAAARRATLETLAAQGMIRASSRRIGFATVDVFTR